MTRVRAVQGIVVGAVLLGLTACGGSDDQAVDAAAATGSAAAATTASAAPTAPPATTKGSGASGDVSASLCAFLTKEAPGLESTGAAALANFSIDFATWVEEDPSHKLTDAEELDSLSTAGCPDARKAILAKLEKPSFAVAFNGS